MHQTIEAVFALGSAVDKPDGSVGISITTPVTPLHQRVMAEKSKEAADVGKEETVVVSKAKLQDLQQQVRALQAAAGSAPTTAA